MQEPLILLGRELTEAFGGILPPFKIQENHALI
jgi:hypothetical protein